MPLLPGPAWLSQDGRLILMARSLRTFGYGLVGVVLGVHVAELGLGGFELGLILAAAFAGSSAFTILVALHADRLGRRRTLRMFAALMAITGTAYALSDQFWLLLLVSMSGTISAGIQEVGPFLSIEQAVLPQTAPDARRTRVFTMYNLLGTGAAALGALYAGGVAIAAGALGLDPLTGHRVLFGTYAILAVCTLGLLLALSPSVERGPAPALAGFLGIDKSRSIVTRLALLFGVDSFGGAFIGQSFIAYWFTLRFGVGVEELGPIFAASNLLAALSQIAAERLAARFGLLNTMVFTHIPANLMVIGMAFAPTLPIAILIQLGRSALAQMDVPTRQSYLMAVVDPAERTAAAGFTTVGRNVAQSIAPPIAGLALQTPLLGLPLVLGGIIKVAYDLGLWRMFRAIRPPEEQ